MKRFLRIILILAVIAFVIYFAYFLFALSAFSNSRDYLDDLRIISDDGKYELVIREWNWLRAGGAEIYCVKDGEMVKLGSTIAMDLINPFNRGDYHIQWTDAYVIIKYRLYRGEETNDPDTWAVEEYLLP